MQIATVNRRLFILVLLGIIALQFIPYFQRFQEQSPAPENLSADSLLFKQKWFLHSVRTNGPNQTLLWSFPESWDWLKNDESRFWIQFGKDGAWSAETGCNHINGTWAAKKNGGEMNLSLGFSTLVGCIAFERIDNRERSLMEIEDQFLGALRSTLRYVVSGDELLLFFDKDEKALIFKTKRVIT